jgi:GT2 family glycosyltransferase
MDDRPDIGVATPLLRGPDGAPEMVARALPALGWRTLEMLRLHHFASADARSRHLMGHYWTGSERIDGWVPGAAMILRRSAVEQVGVLSEASFMYGEDLELCWRMLRHGWSVGVCHETEFLHVKGASSSAAWTGREVELRIADAELAVARDMKGRVWAGAYALVVGVSHLIESLHPRRSADQRATHRLVARTWLGRAWR